MKMKYVIYADGIRGMQYGIQDPASVLQEGIISFHNDLMVVLVFVVVFVSVVLGRTLFRFEQSKSKIASSEVHGTVLEIVWTIVPAIVLMLVAIPSFTLLYAVDEVVDPSLTVKVTGHQWYWTYELSDIGDGVEFDSYMLAEEDLDSGELRLLEVDNRLVLPVETHIRFIVTSGDVLHSFAVPSFGIKIDACPGRLNEVTTFVKRPGVFYGQCSELCGINHSFMPICIEVVKMSQYLKWLMQEDE